MHKGKMFQIADRNHWRVLVTTPKQIDELRKLPDGVLDADIVPEEVCQFQFLIIQTLINIIASESFLYTWPYYDLQPISHTSLKELQQRPLNPFSRVVR
jgi:hypothetical protein